MSRDAQDEDLKTSTLSETSEDLQPQTNNSNGVLDNCLGESSTYNNNSSLLETSNHSDLSEASSSKTKRNPLDLSPENFFMTSNEINGQLL